MNNDDFTSDMIALGILFAMVLGIWGITLAVSIWKAHTHKWVEVERWQTTGVATAGGDYKGSGEQLQRLVFGVTTIRYECACGEHQFKEILGGQR